MIIPKRTIPRVGLATLVIGGCSDDVVVSTPIDAADALCTYLQRCEPGEFVTDFASFSQCRDYYARSIEEYVDYYRREYGFACGDAIEEYYLCLGQLLADTNGRDSCATPNESVECAVEIARVDDLCP